MTAPLALTAARIAMIDPLKAVVKSYIAGVAITKGQPVYIIAATGKIGLCTGAAANQAAQFRGIALNAGSAGQAIDVLEDGEVEGYTLTGAYDAIVYVDDVAGNLSETTGTVGVIVGRISPMSNGARTPVVRIFVSRGTTWS